MLTPVALMGPSRALHRALQQNAPTTVMLTRSFRPVVDKSLDAKTNKTGLITHHRGFKTSVRREMPLLPAVAVSALGLLKAS